MAAQPNATPEIHKAENIGSMHNGQEAVISAANDMATPAAAKSTSWFRSDGNRNNDETQNRQVDRKISEKILGMTQDEEPQMELAAAVDELEEVDEEGLESQGWGCCSCGANADETTQLKVDEEGAAEEENAMPDMLESNVPEHTEAVETAEVAEEEAKNAANDVEKMEEKLDEEIEEPSAQEEEEALAPASRRGSVAQSIWSCCCARKGGDDEFVVVPEEAEHEVAEGEEGLTEKSEEQRLVEEGNEADAGEKQITEDGLETVEGEVVPGDEAQAAGKSGGWCYWCCNAEDITSEMRTEDEMKEAEDAEAAAQHMVLTTESSVEMPLGNAPAPSVTVTADLPVEEAAGMDAVVKDEIRKSSAETTKDSSRRGEDTERKTSGSDLPRVTRAEPEVPSSVEQQEKVGGDMEEEEVQDETDVFFNSAEERYEVLKAQCPETDETTLRRWASPVGCYLVYDAAARAPFSSAWSDKPVNNAIAFFSVGENIPIPTHKLRKRDREALTMERGNPKKVVKTAFLAFAKLCHRYSGDFSIRASRVWHSMGMGSVEVVWLDAENHLMFCKRNSIPTSTQGCQAVAVVENSFRLQGGRPKQKMKPTWAKAAFSSTTRSIAGSAYSELDSLSVVKPML